MKIIDTLLCEEITKDFIPLNPRDNFYVNHKSVSVLVVIDKVIKPFEIEFLWTKQNNIHFSHKMHMVVNYKRIRFATCSISPYNLIEKNKQSENWKVIINGYEEKRELYFSVKRVNYSFYELLFDTNSSTLFNVSI